LKQEINHFEKYFSLRKNLIKTILTKYLDVKQSEFMDMSYQNLELLIQSTGNKYLGMIRVRCVSHKLLGKKIIDYGNLMKNKF